MTDTPTTLPLCAECLHPRPDRHRDTCTTQIQQLFATIDERAAMLDIRRDQTNALGEGNSPGFVSSPPIDLTARTHMDPASLACKVGPDDVNRPTLSVDRTLDVWARKAAAVRGDYRNARWVTAQPWVGSMVAELRILAAQLLAATGDPLPKPVGRCTRVTIVGDEWVECGESLFMPRSAQPRGDDESIRDLPDIRCPRPGCHEIYQGSDLIRLKLAAERDNRRARAGLVSMTEGTYCRTGEVFDPVDAGSVGESAA